MAHEYSHIELRHQEQNGKLGDAEVESVRFEKEADARAIELALDGITEENKMTTHIGLLMGLCSLLFLSDTLKGIGYPDTDDRIDAILLSFNQMTKMQCTVLLRSLTNYGRGYIISLWNGRRG